MIYGFVKFQGIEKFDYVESLSFGAIVSATDPGMYVPILQIFMYKSFHIHSYNALVV
jgi:NhaP-type Na+/H+ or K+/H+ antiporter